MSFKNLCTNIMYNLFSLDREKLEKKIESSTYVSFDVFDTLVKRNVADPKDVFKYLEKHAKDDSSRQIDNFADLRIAAEQKARDHAPNREITLLEIYEYIPMETLQKEYFMQMECQAELDFATVNPRIKALYDFCIANGKQVYFISDMYLPIDVVKRIVHKCGYDRGNLFVSSQCGLTKHSGKLFEYVRNKEKLNYAEWVHIGDSISSDFLIPRHMGIRAFLVERHFRINPYVDRKLNKKDSDYKQLVHFIDVHIGRHENPYERIGYAVLGPLLYGFAIWLKHEIPQDETIIFLAREGAILKKAFEVISDRPSVYLRISRHSLNRVRIDHAKNVDDILEERIDSIARLSSQKSWARIFGMEDKDIKILFQREGLNENDPVVNSDMKAKVLNTIWPMVKKMNQGQYDLFQQYLKQLGITKKCAIVDIGWQGTMQTILSHLNLHAGHETIQWDGYYLGIHPRGQKPPFNVVKKRAFLFSGTGDNLRIMESMAHTSAFTESIFLSTDGTTTGYEVVADEVKPILGKPDNRDDVKQKFLLIQSAGVEFVKDVNSTTNILNISSPIVAAANFVTIAREPTLATLKLFKKARFYEEDTVDLVGGQPLWWYFLHPKRFVFDFANSLNKSWFLKNVFKIPFPYMSMIRLAKKLTGEGKI